jgi:tRNA pseudouridine(55) synthase/riboflavin kinase/FMN adenylyltransferase/tRNA threonylcarbamoyl adenosine modification protein (Sua5/YciO/YrdC/YwlC family)
LKPLPRDKNCTFDGILLIDKPAGISSAGVDRRIKHRLAEILGVSLRAAPKVGHAGTLDPFATGVQVVGIGSATKELGSFTELKKTYSATFVLGERRDTDDLTGTIIEKRDAVGLTQADVVNALQEFQGKIVQTPCSVSAKSVNGQRAYDCARRGEEIELQPVEVEVYDSELLAFRSAGELVEVDVKFEVSKGTFIRAIARDLGELLGVGGYVSALRREKIGDQIESKMLLSVDEVLGFDATELKTVIQRYFTGTCLTLGNFDGVHLGHQKLVRTAVDKAEGSALKSVVLIIDNECSREETLTTLEQRVNLIKNLGVDEVQVIDFADIKGLTYEEFLTNLIGSFNMRSFVCAPDVAVGKDRRGDRAALASYLDEKGVSLEVVEFENEPPSKRDAHQKVSSTTIRGLLRTGDVKEAARLLGRTYKLSGNVTRGFGRGMKIGFPTANIDGIETIIPADGVYCGSVTFTQVVGRERHPAMISIGTNPTFNNQKRTVEVNIPGRTDFALYDKNITVSFDATIRPMVKFDSVVKLTERLKYDAKLTSAVWKLTHNEIAVIPTDTVLGIVSSLDKSAGEKIFQVKGRSHSKPLQVVVDGISQARQIGVFPKDFDPELEEKLLDGRLTIVVKTNPNSKYARELGETVGIRIPKECPLADVLKLYSPLFASSANLSGEPVFNTVQEARKAFGASVSFYFDTDTPRTGVSSEVVDFSASTPHILRRSV